MGSCCSKNQKKRSGFWPGLFSGLIPHAFCIAFLVLSLIGATSGTLLAKKFLLIPHFFLFLTIISFLFATLSAIFYLKKCHCLSTAGIRNRWKYLTTMYIATIAINLLMAYVVLPASANLAVQNNNQKNASELLTTNIDVQLPCPGHSPLITSELEKVSGVENVAFKLPQNFQITYDPKETSPQEIAALEIFKTFKLKFN